MNIIRISSNCQQLLVLTAIMTWSLRQPWSTYYFTLSKDKGFWKQCKEVQSSLSAISSKHECSIAGCPYRASKFACKLELNDKYDWKYCYTSRNKYERGSNIINTVFGEATKNHIRGRSKGNGNCNRHNGYVVKTKTKDTVGLLLWYRKAYIRPVPTTNSPNHRPMHS